jgi:hypothetical protein
MSKVMLLGGKPLMVGGKVALSTDCCCGGGGCDACSLPADTCPHAICFEVNIDAQEVSDNSFSEDFISAEAADASSLFAVDVDYQDFGGGALWYLYTRDSTQSTVPISGNDPSLLPGVWHCIQISIVGIVGGFRLRLTVDGVTASGTADVTSLSDFGRFIAGNDSSHGLSVHRSIRNISVLANPSTAEENFIFTGDSFNSLTGGASIVGDTVRFDAGLGTSFNYALKTLSPQHELDCVCVAENLTYFNTIAAALHVDAIGPGGCDLNFSNNFNVSWTRVDRNFGAPANPPPTQFQLYNDCTFGLDTNGDIFNTSVGGTALPIPSQSAIVTPCTGGDSAGIGLGGSIQFNAAGGQMDVVLSLTAQCLLGMVALCTLSDIFSGNTIIPSTFQNLPGIYTVAGTTTPSGWTINYSVVVTVS